ncbi:hypothetical protein WBG78_27740 [Chryseolinea sp. T2]|uniref:hypothetical protein n=1 Tax=Chryseolinea sp. T2 TaxID=3129255 RepID=UPI003077A9BD
MAKQDSLFKYQGTFRKVTQVNSKTWGEHLRAARGTYKKAELNDAFKKSAAETPIANILAKTIKDLFLPHMNDFKDGRMWSRMLSIFKLQLSKEVDGPPKLEEFEFNKAAPLRHLILWKEEVAASLDGNALQLAVTTQCVSKRVMTESYRQTFIVTFYTPSLKGIGKALADSAIIPRDKSTWYDHRASFDIPDDASIAIVALKCELFQDGQVVDKPKSAMDIVKLLYVGID